MSKLFLLTSSKCLSNSFHMEQYHLNANVENYFPFNILGAKERNFEVYLNSGNIAWAFLVTRLTVSGLLEAHCAV